MFQSTNNIKYKAIKKERRGRVKALGSSFLQMPQVYGHCIILNLYCTDSLSYVNTVLMNYYLYILNFKESLYTSI